MASLSVSSFERATVASVLDASSRTVTTRGWDMGLDWDKGMGLDLWAVQCVMVVHTTPHLSKQRTHEVGQSSNCSNCCSLSHQARPLWFRTCWLQ